MKNVTVHVLMGFVLLTSSPAIASHPLKKIFVQGEHQYNQGNYNEAIKHFEETLKIFPKFAPSYNYLGLCHKAIGSDPKKIISMFEKSAELDPNYAPAFDNLAKSYYTLGDFEKAEVNGRKAIELDPNSVSSRLSLGWVYLIGLEKPADAIVHFEYVTKDLEIPYAYFGLGMAYYMNEERFKVIDMVTKLRGLKEEQLAMQLEQMMRDGSYKASAQGGALASIVMPKRQRGAVVGDPALNLTSYSDPFQKKSMPVRLRASAPTSSFQNDFKNAPPITGNQRIRNYQQNYQKGSGH